MNNACLQAEIPRAFLLCERVSQPASQLDTCTAPENRAPENRALDALTLVDACTALENRAQAFRALKNRAPENRALDVWP